MSGNILLCDYLELKIFFQARLNFFLKAGLPSRVERLMTLKSYDWTTCLFPSSGRQSHAKKQSNIHRQVDLKRHREEK